MLYSHRFDAGCNAITLSDELTEGRESPMLGFGLENGGIGVVELMRSKSRMLWYLEPIQMQGGDCAPVSLVKIYHLERKAGLKQHGSDELVSDFIVARDDGRVEIYNYTQASAFPTLCFEVQLKGTITGLDVGNITASAAKDVLIACYDGQIISLVGTK